MLEFNKVNRDVLANTRNVRTCNMPSMSQLLQAQEPRCDGYFEKALAWVRGSSDSVTKLGASGAGAPASPQFS